MRPELQDLDAEMAALGAVFVDQGAWAEITELLKPEMFAHEELRRIAVAMRQLVAEKKPPGDLVVLQPLLPPSTFATCLELSGAFGTAANVRHYAERVRGLWAEREYRRVLAEAAQDGEGGIETRIGKVVQALLAVEAGKPARVRTMKDMLLDFWDRLDEEKKAANEGKVATVFATGFSRLDQILGGGFRARRPTVFGAYPDQGKTAFAIALMLGLAQRGHACHRFELEDDWDDAIRRMTSATVKIKAHLIRNGALMQATDWERLLASGDKLAGLPITLDDSHGLTADQIANRMVKVTREYGTKVFFIDHLGEVGVDKRHERRDRNDLEVGAKTAVIRDAAAELGVAVVLLSQLNRAGDRRADPSPKLSDLRGSGDVEGIGRTIAFLSTPLDESGEFTGQFIVDVKKNKGPKGRVVLRWLPEYATVGEPDPSQMAFAPKRPPPKPYRRAPHPSHLAPVED